MTVKIIEYGGVITEILVPDKNGKLGDINLGYDSMEGKCSVQTFWSLQYWHCDLNCNNLVLNFDTPEYYKSSRDGFCYLQTIKKLNF